MVYRDYLAQWVLKETRDLLETQEQMENLVHLDQEDLLELMEVLANLE